jgi:hypothetical protein
MSPHDPSASIDDLEFRRAQEMALAVAALAPMQSPRRGRSKRSKKRTAQEIRMAVADVLCANPSVVHTSVAHNTTASAGNSPPKKKPTIKLEEKDDDDEELNVLQHLLGPLVDDHLQENQFYKENVEGKSLEGWNLVSCWLMVNLSLLYLSIGQENGLSRFLHTSFVIHMTFLYCMDTPKTYTSSTYRNNNKNQKEDFQQADSIKTPEQNIQIQPIERESTIKLEWLENVSFQQLDLQDLELLQPKSTRAERRRFLKARKFSVKAASAQLGQYLDWRLQNRVEEFFPSTYSSDEEDWAHAARGAMELANTSGKHADIKKLPRLVSVFEDDLSEVVVCNNGARVVHVLPCQLDSSLATSSTYALAVAMYLDRKLDREFTEKVTVVIDIRSGQGWSNPSSVSIVPFIKLVVGLLNTYFPERLSRCILYPLPYTATLLFNKAKDYLDPDTASKIQVCSGAGSTKSPIPEKVKEFIGPQAIACMETRRTSFF